jgi:hypothetical protein
VEAQRRAGGYADLVARNRTQDEGARRSTETVNDHGLAGRVQAPKFVDVASDLAAPIIRYTNCRVTGPHIRKQQCRGNQTSCELHLPPWFEQIDWIVCVMRETAEAFARVRGYI